MPQVSQDLWQQTDPPGDELLTAEQVADWLKITVRFLHKLIREGDGPSYVQVSPLKRHFRRSAVQEWINSRSEVVSP